MGGTLNYVTRYVVISPVVIPAAGARSSTREFIGPAARDNHSVPALDSCMRKTKYIIYRLYGLRAPG